MNILSQLQHRFRAALAPLESDPTELAKLVDMVRPAQDRTFGDYQANVAMPLGKRLGRSPRDVATELVGRLDVADLCEPPEIAGPGFINLRLKTSWLAEQLSAALDDERLGIPKVDKPRTYVIDYSSPNVAKPMHVGHIRSSVIGAALDRTLRFVGHRVVSDNHIGDWGTQFGMILYGYKNFVDADAYRRDPVRELGRLYRLVNRLMEYPEHVTKRDRLRVVLANPLTLVEQMVAEAAGPAGKPPKPEALAKARHKAERKVREMQDELAVVESQVVDLECDPSAMHYLGHHAGIAAAALAETAKLHAGDPENLRLWKEFLPACRDEIDRIYRRLDLKFDHTLGESFYHDRLAGVVEDLIAKKIARESEGAICVFLPGHNAPLIVRKQDGAFLYATTDLATIQYRMHEWKPDAILYVVDHRQSLHFEQLFATARLWGYQEVELVHVAFGTVLGADGKPYKTRSGDNVGLESLLDEAVARAHAIVSQNDDAKPAGAELSEAERREVAEAVGIGAIKYADLSQNRTSDYEFSYDKMLAMNGNTATYMQYAHARAGSVMAKAGANAEGLRHSPGGLSIAEPAERALALALLQLGEVFPAVLADYRPNHLTSYLFELANRFSTFWEQCPVIRAESDEVRRSRLLLCDLTARTIRLGLGLLGIRVVERM
ncbi:MAG TPA: arginine--tRNA ligase [Pirellulales bacterium]|jgi:arginyl-tRNA synthetase|nr:arginine--tRNA ligase [Pirellulales bacterium]